MHTHTIHTRTHTQTQTHAHTHILHICITGMGYRVLPGCQPCILWGWLAVSRRGACTWLSAATISSWGPPGFCPNPEQKSRGWVGRHMCPQQWASCHRQGMVLLGHAGALEKSHCVHTNTCLTPCCSPTPALIHVRAHKPYIGSPALPSPNLPRQCLPRTLGSVGGTRGDSRFNPALSLAPPPRSHVIVPG